MSKECLIKKYKASVQNDNLPCYDKVTLDYSAAGQQKELLIRAGYKAVTVSFKKPVHKSQLTGSLITSDVISALSTTAYFLDSSYSTDYIKDFVTIDSIYSVKELIAEESFVVGKGFDSLLYNENIFGYGCSFKSIPNAIPATTKLLCLGLPTSTVRCSLSQIKNSDSIDFLYGLCSLDTNQFTLYILADYSLKNSAMRFLNALVVGDITNIPKKTIALRSITSNLTGTIESLVEEMRANGRPNGNIAIFDYPSGINVTFGGVKLKDAGITIFNENGIFNGSYYILEWTPTTISFRSTDNTCDYTTLYPNGLTLFSYDPNLVID